MYLNCGLNRLVGRWLITKPSIPSSVLDRKRVSVDGLSPECVTVRTNQTTHYLEI